MSYINIAIDGPVGSGKSTIAKIIAEKLNFNYLDTGAMYRTLALKVINSGVDTKDSENVVKILNNIDMRVEFQGRNQVNYLEGRNVNDLIRTPEVSMGASNVSAIPEVRTRLVEMQREIGKRNSIVMEGRDIGTNVLPSAQYKFFLTATPEERAKRRYNEMIAKGDNSMTLEQVKEDLLKRDEQDSTRKVAPLKVADDAVVIDTTGMNIEEVTESLMGYIKERA